MYEIEDIPVIDVPKKRGRPKTTPIFVTKTRKVKSDRKLSELEVVEIRNSELKQTELAAKFGITKQMVSLIQLGRVYNDVPGQIKISQSLTWNDKAIELLKSDKSNRELASLLKLDRSQVSHKRNALGVKYLESVKRVKASIVVTKNKQPWTEEEISLLSSDKSDAHIAKELGRTIFAIANKRRHLKRKQEGDK